MQKHCSIAANVMLVAVAMSAVAQDWKTYPYHQQGSAIYFPDDEGWHPEMKVEWWYTNAHVTGDSTGTEYSFMLTYFYYPVPGFEYFRIFNIANETAGEFFQETLPYQVRVLAQDHLDIQVTVSGGADEEWVTLRDKDGNLIPFQYHLAAHSRHGSIDVRYDAVKRPLMAGGTGFLRQGAANRTYYYSQTLLNVDGTLTLQGVTEPVRGTAWIDRQYFDAINPLSGESYEWFSCQLSNGMDLNIWNIFDPQDRIPNTPDYRICTAYVSDDSSFTTSDFELRRRQYHCTSDGERCYARQWDFSHAGINLRITTVFDEQEVELPFRFYEGSTTIAGTVDGETVTGVGFAELIHSYQHPDVRMLSPNGGEVWDGSLPVTWQLLNPDDGRPVSYDLELSTDDRATYVPIAQGLVDTVYHWDVAGVDRGARCWLRVTGYSGDGTLVGSDETDSSFAIVTSAVREPDEPAVVARGYSVTAFPNPAHHHATVSFHLPTPARVTLNVYDVLGREMAVLVDGVEDAGGHDVDFDASQFPSGTYFYQLKVDEITITKRVIVIN